MVVCPVFLINGDAKLASRKALAIFFVPSFIWWMRVMYNV